MSAAALAAIAAALLLCSLTAGFLLGFAVVVMPGLGTLDDAAYLRSFQVIDRVIQDGQPLFGLVWVGSVIALLAALVLGIPGLPPVDRLLLAAAGLLYLVGVQLPTALINIPLNNQLQRLSIDDLDESTARREREAFEGRWNRWNAIRTGLAIGASILLLGVVVRA